MRFLGQEFELNKRYNLGMVKHNNYSSDWLEEYIFPVINDHLCCESCFASDWMWFKPTIDEDFFSYDGEEYRGDFLYRLIKYYEVVEGKRITKGETRDLKEVIGKTSIHSIATNVAIEITNIIDWQAGEFMENDTSCWWGSYSRGRTVFEYGMQLGWCGAIKIYTEGENYGRCFFVLEGNDNIILFNYYGEMSNQDFYNLFASHFGALTNQRVGLAFQSPTGDSVYVNEGRGNFFGLERNAARPGAYNFDIPYSTPVRELELRRYGVHRSPDVKICDECGRGEYLSSFFTFRPHEGEYCATCIRNHYLVHYKNRMNGWDYLYDMGKRIYYDPKYYMRSKKSYKIVRKAQVPLPETLKEQEIETDESYS